MSEAKEPLVIELTIDQALNLIVSLTKAVSKNDTQYCQVFSASFLCPVDQYVFFGVQEPLAPALNIDSERRACVELKKLSAKSELTDCAQVFEVTSWDAARIFEAGYRYAGEKLK
jgi:hypothetical protein